MDFAQMLPWAVFIGIALGIVAIASVFGRKANRSTERLDILKNPQTRKLGLGEKGDPGAPEKTGMGKVIEQAAPALSKALQPATDLEKSALKLRLANAGFNS